MKESSEGRGVLRAIAIYKFVKTTLLAFLALAAFELLGGDHLERFTDYLRHLPLAEGHRAFRELLAPMLSLRLGQVEAAGFVATFYALLFGVEGVGLWRGKRWAEYFTLIATASLIPLEAWAFVDKPTWLRATALVVNIAIVAFLYVFVRRQRQRYGVGREVA